MSKESDRYNLKKLLSGEIWTEHITALVKSYQKTYGLTVDGKLGPQTKAHLQQYIEVVVYPLPQLSDGRVPRITSDYKDRNITRANHNGVDFFYQSAKSDPPWPKGDGGGTKNGKWIVPPGTPAIAIDHGTVVLAGNSPTGYRVWIAHKGGYRSGYFHLENIFVEENQTVIPGEQIGLVGHNPKDKDARHLHFEISLNNKEKPYNPVDPIPYLHDAVYVPLDQTKGSVKDIKLV